MLRPGGDIGHGSMRAIGAWRPDVARELRHTHEHVCLMKVAVCDSHTSVWTVCARIWANYNVVCVRASERCASSRVSVCGARFISRTVLL